MNEHRHREEDNSAAQRSLLGSKSKVTDGSSSLSSPSKTTKNATGGADNNMMNQARTADASVNASATMNTTTTTTKVSNAELELGDPTKFWAAWSARKQHDCLDGDDGNDNKKGCNCFEGLGSVM